MENMTNKYEVIFQPEEETALIRVLEGKFTDFIYQYHNVSIGEVNEDETVNLSYTYDLKEAPESYQYHLLDGDQKEFEQVVGDILFDIIANSDQVKEASGNDNTK